MNKREKNLKNGWSSLSPAVQMKKLFLNFFYNIRKYTQNCISTIKQAVKINVFFILDLDNEVMNRGIKEQCLLK